MSNDFLKRYIEVLKNDKRCWFSNEMLENCFTRNGYEYRKHKDKKGNEFGKKVWINKNNESEFINNRELTKSLNGIDYFYDKTFKMWLKQNERAKEILCGQYVKEIDRIGTERYCSFDEEYIDTPWTELKISIHDYLLDELQEEADERGMDLDLYIEYKLLKQEEKERPRKRDKIIKQYLEEEFECEENEIEFIMMLMKYKQFYEDDITYYLDIFYWFYLRAKGYTEQQLNFIFTDVELPQYHYQVKKKDNEKSFEDIQNMLRVNEFEIDHEYEYVNISRYIANEKFIPVVTKIAIEFINDIE